MLVLLLCCCLVLSCCGCGFGLHRTAQNFALFLPFPATVSLFLCLSGCLLVEFWWCLEAPGRDPQMCMFGLSGCGVKPRAASWNVETVQYSRESYMGACHASFLELLRTAYCRGFTRQNSNVHILGQWSFKHHQNSTRRPPREGRMNEMGAGDGKKKREILGPHPSGPHPSGQVWPKSAN